LRRVHRGLGLMATIGEVRSRLRVGRTRKVRLWSQRLEEPPFLNCRYFGWLSQAWWAGLRWDGGNATALAITDLLRKRSGRPEFINGEAQGSSSADLDRALAAVLPWMRITHRMVPDDQLLEHLGSRYVAGVAVWLPALPTR
jgi:hypothetical protein